MGKTLVRRFLETQCLLDVPQTGLIAERLAVDSLAKWHVFRGIICKPVLVLYKVVLEPAWSEWTLRAGDAPACHQTVPRRKTNVLRWPQVLRHLLSECRLVPAPLEHIFGHFLTSNKNLTYVTMLYFCSQDLNINILIFLLLGDVVIWMLKSH